MMHYCEDCDVNVSAKGYAGHCKSLTHKQNCRVSHCDGVELIKSAFKGNISLYRVHAKSLTTDLEEFEQQTKDICLKLSADVLNDYKQFKVHFELFGLYYLSSKNISEIKSFNTKSETVYTMDQFKAVWIKNFRVLHTKMEQFAEKDSGWILSQILFLELTLCKLKHF